MSKNTSNPNNSITVTFFGKFHIESNNGALDNDNISSEKITKLLSYFLVHHDRFLPIQELTDILWSDETSSNPTGALKNLVYRMRTLLKKYLGDADYIQTGRGAYNWNTDIPLLMDFEIFDRCLADARSSDDMSEQIHSLENALQLYQGAFMSNIPSEHWVIPLSTYYHTSYLDAVKKLADLYQKEQRYRDIITICNQGLIHEPLDETLHYYIVRSFMDMKENNQALTHYNKAIQQLQQTLGINSPSLLKSLHAELLAMNNVTEANLDEVQEQLVEEYLEGAYACPYSIFREIYRLEVRRIQRLGISEFIVLFTIEAGKNKLSNKEAQFHLMKKAVTRLENILKSALRSGDVITRYSEFQIAVLLPTCTYESAVMVSDRMLSRFRAEIKLHQVAVNYSIDEVTPSNSFIH
ncbi:MAG: hypothetical protein EOM40_09495 [Clostridia bacterium]|nr:hypothetical protein [Clostridia bacterium]NCC42391.1 hypothetical protein [Clostridia bacterium]